MDESATSTITTTEESVVENPELSLVPPLPSEPADSHSKSHSELTTDELVAKSIAPINKHFLRPPPLRPSSNDAVSQATTTAIATANGAPAPSQSSFVKDKKSKRQLKRERRQDQKSSKNICPLIAKTGDITSCPYNDKCRFSHDVEGFKAQKPEDIEGECPFLVSEEPCPYGLACRFLGTHKSKDKDGVLGGKKKMSDECNGLNKDVQKLLWKNKMKFPKADAKLKALGLLGKAKSKTKIVEEKEDDETVPGTCHVSDGNGVSEVNGDLDTKLESAEVPEEDDLDKKVGSDEPPMKKPKSVIEENGSSAKANNGDVTFMEKVVGENCTQTEPEAGMDVTTPEGDRSLKLHPREKKIIDFREKLYLAPLTTVGNLPFRRICKVLGADVTCGEMAMCTNLLQGQASEWALLRRHSSEDLFGVQICGAYPDTVARAMELIDQECTVDFIDINMGCPIDIVVEKGAGSALLNKPMRIKSIIEAASGTVDKPITVKVRTGFFEGKNRIDSLITDIGNWGASAVTIHGRSRQQRYSKLANWDYVYQCARKAPDALQVMGNGDVFSYLDWNTRKADCPELATCMIARGALIKPWIFTEIKEQRHWDITSGERLNILKDFVRLGLEHWGSDTKGVETTRRFLLEWLSYTCRYIPVGLLDVIPQRLNWRPPSYYGRDDLETLMVSDSAADWVRISEMLLGKVPDGFTFAPKHKSNAYDRAENG